MYLMAEPPSELISRTLGQSFKPRGVSLEMILSTIGEAGRRKVAHHPARPPAAPSAPAGLPSAIRRRGPLRLCMHRVEARYP